MNRLSQLGFDDWFVQSVDPGLLEQFSIARVTSVQRDRYHINNGERELVAELSGKIMFSATTPLDYPTVGDWVLAAIYDDDLLSIIHEILPRKSILKRKTPGKKIDIQLIASNIDVAFIVQSLNEDFNLRRLERYLVMVNDSQIRPCIVLNKSDLMAKDEIATKVAEIKDIAPDADILTISCVDSTGLELLESRLSPGMTFCLLGSSGVGKTTLINTLLGSTDFKTATVSRIESKGRHTTTSRELIRLPGGALIIDTPGMRELGNFAIETGMEETFADIISLAKECRFNDCTHTNEQGCAVLRAVEDGRLTQGRYQNYQKMLREVAFNESSYIEKRKKNKEFGKFVKQVMKHKNR